MKKVILFAAVLSAFSFASCKKDRICTCVQSYSSGGVTQPIPDDVRTYTAATKNQAMSHCLSQTRTGDSNGTPYTYTATCTLK